MAWTSPRTWVLGEIITASVMNTHIRDNFNATEPAIVTTDGDIVVATAAHALKRLSAMTGDLFTHEVGMLETDISAITTGDTIVGQSSGVLGLETAMSQVQAEAGTDTQVRGVTAERLKQAINELAVSTPSGTIAFFRASCPSGWTEYTAARGRYIVGTPSGGSATATVGTAMSDKENRPVGEHKHGADVGSANRNSHHGTDPLAGGDAGSGSDNNNVMSNAGNVADTNAPYIQLICCKKD